MDKHLKKRWVTALRSGQYTQGTGCLRNGSKFCCLGVLCDLRNPSGWEECGPEHNVYYPGTYRFAGRLADLESNIVDAEAQRHLVRMNDLGASFATIADWIEVNL